MTRFYFLRHIDMSGYSGTGVVAEGVIFDFGYGAFTWLTNKKTVTVFDNMGDIDFMHGHGGKTDIILENDERFLECETIAKAIKQKRKVEERVEESRKERKREQAKARRAKKKAEAIKT